MDDVEALLLRSFYGDLPDSKSGMEMPKVPVVSRYFVAYVASFVAVAPFVRAKVAPFFRAKDKPQTGTVKFFDKALCKLAGMKVMALSAYLHRKAIGTSGFLPSIARIAPRTPRRPRLTVAMGRGGRPRTRRMSRSAPWRPSLHRMMLTTRAGNEARSAQLFLLLSDIAWYIAGAGSYIPPFISGVLYSEDAI